MLTSSYYERLLDAIKCHKTGVVRKLLTVVSDEDKRHLLWGEESLLDVAASGWQRAVMLLLIENGVTK
jgi:hypothetical protein